MERSEYLVERSEYLVERSEYLVERSDQRMERSGRNSSSDFTSDVTLHKSERGREETKISVICYSSCASKALYSENLLFFLGFCQRLLLFYAKLFHIRKIPSLLFFVNTQSFSTFNNGFGILISIHSHQFLSSIGF